MQKRGLGKGLDALLSPRGGAKSAESNLNEQLRVLPVDIVVRGQYQPRMEMNSEALEELANSIKSQGVVQPIVVRPLKGTNTYEIIAGERRWRATQLAGLHEIPAIIKDVSDQTAMCLALIENIQREDLNPMDEARALSRLLQEFDMTHDAAAEAVGRSRSSVSNLLRLLDLHIDVQHLLETGKIEMGHGRAILGLDIGIQTEVATKVIKQGLSVRATEQLVKGLKSNGLNPNSSKKTKPSSKLDPNLRSLQEDLSERLGAAVSIKHTKSGKGMLEISYNSLDELDGILTRIK
ncbi:MAG: ParB family chromosome partitioning protein [Gammaproteobacteria bacterium]|jgi:ParB family transcriptional regulator, chromosome partitioning protein